MENHQREDFEHGLSCGCGHCHDGIGQKKQDYKSEKGFFAVYAEQITRLILAIAFFITAFFLPNIYNIISFSVSAVIVGYGLVISLVKNIIKLNFFNESALMFIASVTAFILGEYFEGTLIVILFFLGEFLEQIATDNSRKKIAGLSVLKSTVAHLIDKSGMKDVLPNEVAVGSLIEVKSGEAVPIDGILIGTYAELDLKAVTGESKYYSVSNGQTVYSGAINVGNPIVIKSIKEFKDSTVEKIIAMVEGSLSKKAKSQKFITSFARFYTPIIFGLALVIAIIPPLIDGLNFIKWIYKALSFLVISCPCALVISIPLAFFVGIGGLAKKGVLVKGSSYLERLTKINAVVFDKTGTLTYGSFKIDNIEVYDDFNEQNALDYSITLEEKSTHPIAKAICKNKKSNPRLVASLVEEYKGKGLSGIIDGKRIYLGNDKLMAELGICVKEEFAGTILYLANVNTLLAKIFIVDQVKENAKTCLSQLKALGVSKNFILSGDNALIANKVGERVNSDSVYSELLPDQKVEKLKDIQREHGATLFVGDGINDSPSLALADVGIAMGGLGSELATQSADIVIMDDNLEKIPRAIIHAKKVKRAVVQNIIGSLAVKFAVMALSVIITLPVWVAMLADVGVMLIAVCNSLRLGRVK